MRYYQDQYGRVIADHGLGGHYVGGIGALGVSSGGPCTSPWKVCQVVDGSCYCSAGSRTSRCPGSCTAGGVASLGQTVLTVPPCPPRGYPGNTLDAGANCCQPSACVPARATALYAKADCFNFDTLSTTTIVCNSEDWQACCDRKYGKGKSDGGKHSKTEL